ncbi:MAG: hypothetical protein ABIB71_06600, partial [Candidatus Woesearchaeota archaeon]
GYTAKVKSFKDEELYSFKFSASLHAYDLQQEFEEMPVQLIFPHFVNAEMLEIHSSNGKLMLEVDLSDYALCNQDSICDDFEDEAICEEDCPGQAAATEQEDMPESADTGEPLEKTIPALWIYIGALIIAIIVAAVLVIKARKKR